MDVELVDPGDVSGAAVAAALGEAFGRSFDERWLSWKHGGPWGAVEGTVTLVDGEIIGCRFLLPWGIRTPDGQEVVARRAVEAATTAAGRGRGLFRMMNEREMTRIGESGETSFIFSTPNEQSRPAYAKLGWAGLGEVAHVYSVAVPRPVDLRLDDDVLATYREPSPQLTGRAHTRWTPAALRWRVDPRSGNDYVVAGLVRAAESNGIVARVVEARGLRLLLVLHAWGEADEKASLLSGLLWRTRSIALLHTDGRGARPLAARRLRLRRTRGGSHVMVWPGTADPGLTDLGNWALDFADVEGIL